MTGDLVLDLMFLTACVLLIYGAFTKKGIPNEQVS